MLLVSFESFISNPLSILAIVCVAFGITALLLAGKIARVVRKTETIDKQDKLFVGIKIAGVVLILLGFVLLTIWGMEAH